MYLKLIGKSSDLHIQITLDYFFQITESVTNFVTKPSSSLTLTLRSLEAETLLYLWL